MQKTLGGDRLGSGNKMKIGMRNFERSTHDLGYLWRSTMSAGTLVPFMCEVALPGDTFDINLKSKVLTHPTIGPLFGTYKVQYDVFAVPMRLYHSALHMNMLGIGMKMNTIKLPKMRLEGSNIIKRDRAIDNQHVNSSSILSYLGIRGLGYGTGQTPNTITRVFNAIPYLAYWDIYKQYYANKQEGIGYMIHTPVILTDIQIDSAQFEGHDLYVGVGHTGTPVYGKWNNSTQLRVRSGDFPQNYNGDGLMLTIQVAENVYETYAAWTLFNEIEETTDNITFKGYNGAYKFGSYTPVYGIFYLNYQTPHTNNRPRLEDFPLEDIDTMRTKILTSTPTSEFFVTASSNPLSYRKIFEKALTESGDIVTSLQYSQEGLLVKTYQSDLFNNWLDSSFIEGPNGIAEITAVSTIGDKFTIDELNLSKKVYDMLNRIAVSGGSYDDWLDAVYTEKRTRSQENPAYLGGMIKELGFQEVISNASTDTAELGRIAGRGTLLEGQKGGHIVAKIDEPSYIIGIVSITPRIDYSQGNKWDVNLKSMDDLHKPNLDGIGFQDLLTDQIAWFDTMVPNFNDPTFNSAGKQPAWINYMTNVNRVYGNFADPDNQMYMTLCRRYEYQNSEGLIMMKDLTTYIDPSKYNYIFANTALDAQNFWTQISVDIKARRKMSAKLMPNL